MSCRAKRRSASIGFLARASHTRASGLPQAIQQELFESAVRAEGEQMRELIAVFLHGEHDRTKSGVQARAMTEPDSKGG